MLELLLLDKHGVDVTPVLVARDEHACSFTVGRADVSADMLRTVFLQVASDDSFHHEGVVGNRKHRQTSE